MFLIEKVIKKNSYAFGSFLALVCPVIFLFVLHSFFNLLAHLMNFTPYALEKFYLMSISINLLLMRYYLVNVKFLRTGKSILAITFLLMILFFVFQ